MHRVIGANMGKYRKTPNKRPLGGNMQRGIVEGISTFQELFTE